MAHKVGSVDGAVGCCCGNVSRCGVPVCVIADSTDARAPSAKGGASRVVRVNAEQSSNH